MNVLLRSLFAGKRLVSQKELQFRCMHHDCCLVSPATDKGWRMLTEEEMHKNISGSLLLTGCPICFWKKKSGISNGIITICPYGCGVKQYEEWIPIITSDIDNRLIFFQAIVALGNIDAHIRSGGLTIIVADRCSLRDALKKEPIARSV